MKMKGKILGLLVAGSMVLGATGVLAADAATQNTARAQVNYSAKKSVSIQTGISLEKAKQIALKDAKSGNVTRAHLDKENGIWVFEVEVVDKNVEKDYTIDADTGKILEVEVEIDRNLYIPNANNKQTSSNQNQVTKNTVSASDAKITMDKAKEIALKAAKSGKVTQVELDRDYGLLVYEIEVVDGNTQYEYKIDAVSGKIIKTDVETWNTKNTQTPSSVNTKISMEKAKEIALKDAKSGNVTRAELDKENGVWVFEIEIVDKNVEKDYKIHADSGKILDIEVEIDRNLYVPKTSTPAKEAKVSVDKAKEIALKAAKAGQVTKVELDRDYGLLVYEIEVIDGNTQYEYKIDAVSGNIIKTDVEIKRARHTQTQTPSNAKISMDKAKEIALKAAKSGKVTKIELDREYGLLVYEIEVRDGRVEKDYKINALTGEIVRSKVEMDDDDYDDDRYDYDDYYDYDDDDRYDYDDDWFDDDDDDDDDDDRYDD